MYAVSYIRGTAHPTNRSPKGEIVAGHWLQTKPRRCLLGCRSKTAPQKGDASVRTSSRRSSPLLAIPWPGHSVAAEFGAMHTFAVVRQPRRGFAGLRQTPPTPPAPVNPPADLLRGVRRPLQTATNSRPLRPPQTYLGLLQHPPTPVGSDRPLALRAARTRPWKIMTARRAIAVYP